MTCTDLLSGEAVRRHSVVQTDPAVGMAQNFSCSNYYTICNPTIYPSQLELNFSQSGPLSGNEGWNLSHFGPNNSCTCGAWTSGSGSLYYLWASGNSSIASILSGGAAANSSWYGQYGGQTTASFSVTGPYGVSCQIQAPAKVKGVLVLSAAGGVTNYTINRASGTITLQLYATLSEYAQDVVGNIGVSAPANPSGVNLASGSTASNGTVTASPSGPGNFNFPITTPATNSQSGTLTYTISLSTSDPNVTVSGSPMDRYICVGYCG